MSQFADGDRKARPVESKCHSCSQVPTSPQEAQVLPEKHFAGLSWLSCGFRSARPVLANDLGEDGYGDLFRGFSSDFHTYW